MHEAPLTQQAIDNGTALSNKDGAGLYAKLGRHPLAAGGALLAGAGIAFAAARLAMDHSEDESSPGSKPMNSRPERKRKVRGAAKPSGKGRRARDH